DAARSSNAELVWLQRPGNGEVIWQIAARCSTYKKLDKRSALYKAKRKIEKAKAQIRAKAEHPFRVIKASLVTPRSASLVWPRTPRNWLRCLLCQKTVGRKYRTTSDHP